MKSNHGKLVARLLEGVAELCASMAWIRYANNLGNFMIWFVIAGIFLHLSKISRTENKRRPWYEMEMYNVEIKPYSKTEIFILAVLAIGILILLEIIYTRKIVYGTLSVIFALLGISDIIGAIIGFSKNV